jgi:hypothetical protein
MTNTRSLQECFEIIIDAIPLLTNEDIHELSIQNTTIRFATFTLNVSPFKHEKDLAHQQLELAIETIREIAEELLERE